MIGFIDRFSKEVALKENSRTLSFPFFINILNFRVDAYFQTNYDRFCFYENAI